LIPISPITVENILPHVGRPVYAVLHDGTCRFGIIRGCSGGQLYLDAVPRGPLSLASVKGTNKGAALAKSIKAGSVHVKGTAARNVKAVKPFKTAKVRTKAWGFGPGFGGWGWGWGWGAAAAAVGLAAIAALFLIPFFFI